MKIRSLIETDRLTFDKEYEVLNVVKGSVFTYYVVEDDNEKGMAVNNYECTLSFKPQGHYRWRKIYKSSGYKKINIPNAVIAYEDERNGSTVGIYRIKKLSQKEEKFNEDMMKQYKTHVAYNKTLGEK